jgi:hypothetical protein
VETLTITRMQVVGRLGLSGCQSNRGDNKRAPQGYLMTHFATGVLIQWQNEVSSDSFVIVLWQINDGTTH